MTAENQTAEEVSGAALRAVLRQVPTPVAVVTGRSAAGELFGITIGSFASVSLEPPLISFNVSEEARTYRQLSEAEQFVVHFLRRDQTALAVRFSDPGLPPAAQFEGLAWAESPAGLPVLADALAVLHCRPHARFGAGDSDIVVGRVIRVESAAVEADPHGAADADPLLYHQRSYRTVRPQALTRPLQEAASETEKRSASRTSDTPAPKSAKS